jgi:hypothetical protein
MEPEHVEVSRPDDLEIREGTLGPLNERIGGTLEEGSSRRAIHRHSVHECSVHNSRSRAEAGHDLAHEGADLRRGCEMSFGT